MNKNTYLSLEEAICNIWEYSNFLQRQLVACCEAQVEGYCFLGVITLINLLEDAIRTSVDNFHDNFNIVSSCAHNAGLLTDKEYLFVSQAENSLRKFRNCLAHKNLATVCLQFSNEPLLYPLTEEETYGHFYEKYSEIIINLILKMLSKNKMVNICLDDLLKNNGFKIHEFTISELLELKGYPSDYTNNVNLTDSE